MDFTPDGKRLIETSRNGGITLVLGAGISQSLNVPGWDELARRLWMHAFGKPLKWKSSKGKTVELPSQLLPMLFELIYEKLQPEGFTKGLRDAMYRDVTIPAKEVLQKSEESIAILGRLLVQEFELGEHRRIRRVLTLNADNCLERIVKHLGSKGTRAIQSIRGPVDHPIAKRGKQAIPLYHLHGHIPDSLGSRLIPQMIRLHEHVLIFTDQQYWNSSASNLSFANRTMGAALHDSHCVFIGLSMQDANILRWLALRHLEFQTIANKQLESFFGAERQSDEKNSFMRLGKKAFKAVTEKPLDRHFWVRPADADPTGLLTQFLKYRGVRSVDIESWGGNEFRKLMNACFTKPRGPRKSRS